MYELPVVDKVDAAEDVTGVVYEVTAGEYGIGAAKVAWPKEPEIRRGGSRPPHVIGLLPCVAIGGGEVRLGGIKELVAE